MRGNRSRFGHGGSILHLAPHIHLTLVLASALPFAVWLRRPAPRSPAVVAVALAFTPVLAAPFLGPWQIAVLGTEGVVEAITGGALLALLGSAIAVRNPWMIVGAAVILAEESDYGQHLLGFETPGFAWLDASRTEHMNFHNGPLSLLWRAVPLAAVLLLAVPSARLAGWLERWRFPAFGASAWAGIVLAIALAFGTTAWLGERFADESFELAVVTLVCATWIRSGVRARPGPSPQPR